MNKTHVFRESLDKKNTQDEVCDQKNKKKRSEESLTVRGSFSKGNWVKENGGSV